MSFEFDTSPQGKQAFWLRQNALRDRLAWLLPQVSVSDIDISTTELSGNAAFVQYVRLHRLTHLSSGQVLHVVEKSIRKVLGITSLEARFYRERGMLATSQHFQHPQCYGVIETPWESLIYTQYIQGRAPSMHRAGAQMAQGIAELEARTFDHLQRAQLGKRWHYWQMDFFKPWYLLRPRFNVAWCLRYLRELAVDDKRFAGLERPLRELLTRLHSKGREVRKTQRCFCHLDYLRKNLFVSPQGLQLIDWSEVKVGRIGFDGGAYLSAVFRRTEMTRYEAVRDAFIAAYREALDPRFDVEEVLANVRYMFVLNALRNCLRPKAIEEFRSRGKLPLLHAKLHYLLTLQPV